MRHAINVVLRHVEASHDYPWPPYIPGLFVAGAIIGPQRGGGGTRADQLWQPQSVRGDQLWRTLMP